MVIEEAREDDSPLELVSAPASPSWFPALSLDLESMATTPKAARDNINMEKKILIG
ncbi:MAG: hypothetical protein VST69_05875 [Nitrospirota bacterium]|nr:hypothetical protein [Nitrospirota bacterium]